MALQEPITVAEYIAEAFHQLSVYHIFGYPGANITYLIDAIAARKGLQYLQTYHEQGAAFCANGYAQSSGNLGVAIASSGPGALNLITGITNAYCDSIPTLFICGDLSHRYKKTGLTLRQDGFQSTDIISVVQPITKYAALVESTEELKRHFEHAVFQATHGRRGPVFLSIPHWIQRSRIHHSPLVSTGQAPFRNCEIPEVLSDVIRKSQRPLLLVGSGCVNTETKQALEAFLSINPIPVIASLCGISAIAHDHPLYIGFIGDYGHRHANIALAAADCLIVLGSRMDERQIGFLRSDISRKTVVHVDIDQAEFFPAAENYFPIPNNAADFLRQASTLSLNKALLIKWLKQLQAVKEMFPILPPPGETLLPATFLSEVFAQLTNNAQIFVDVGTHQMCVAQFGRITHQQQIYFSGGLGSMGYALPAAIGGYFSHPERQTLCIAGDGGLMMSLPELQTIARERINIKIFVMNNQCLGMIRSHQMRALEGRNVGSVEGYLAGDFEKIASAFSLSYRRLENNSDCANISEILRTDGPALIEVMFTQSMQPYPASVDYPLEIDASILNIQDEHQ